MKWKSKRQSFIPSVGLHFGEAPVWILLGNGWNNLWTFFKLATRICEVLPSGNLLSGEKY